MKYIIKIRVDESCEMAEVLLNDELIMMGNYWDFHPGCTGIQEYGDFNSYQSLSTAIYIHLIKKGTLFSDIETITENYSYDDEC